MALELEKSLFSVDFLDLILIWVAFATFYIAQRSVAMDLDQWLEEPYQEDVELCRWQCSECDLASLEELEWCPDCGSRMREDEGLDKDE